jgi:hypothetical protein
VGSICIKLVCGGLCFNRNKKSGDVNIYDMNHHWLGLWCLTEI